MPLTGWVGLLSTDRLIVHNISRQSSTATHRMGRLRPWNPFIGIRWGMRTRPVQQGMSIIRRQLLRAGLADSGMDSQWQAGLLGRQMWHATPLRSVLLPESSHTVLEKTCTAQ